MESGPLHLGDHSAFSPSAVGLLHQLVPSALEAHLLVDTLQRAMDLVREATDADAAEAWLDDEQTSTLRQAAVIPTDSTFLSCQELGHDEGLVGRAFSEQRLVTGNIQHDHHFVRTAIRGAGFVAFCATPIQAGSGRLGVLSIAYRRPARISRRRRGILMQMATAVGLIIAIHRLREAQEAAHVLQAARTAQDRAVGDLQESVLQELSVLIWQINALRPAVTADRLPALQKLTSNAQAIARDVRALMTHLDRDPQAPPLNTGIEARLRAMLAGGAGGLSWQFEYELGEQSLEPGVEALIYRIARALVANVYEHAQARHATLSVTGSREHVSILVRDDGIGFDPARSATGSTGLVEVDRHARTFAGGLKIVSRPGAGSEVSCWLTHSQIDEQPQPKPGNRAMPD